MTDWARLPLRDLGVEVRDNITPKRGELYAHYSVPSFETGVPTLEDGAEIKSTKRALLPGDVLICRINPRINRVWLVGDHSEPIIGSTEWVTLRLPNTSAVDGRYLTWYLRSPRFRAAITSAVSGVTGSHTRAKPRQILGYEVPVPPLDEQRAIVETIERMLSHLDAALTTLSVASHRLELLQEAVDRYATYGHLHDVVGNRADAVAAVVACRGDRAADGILRAPSPDLVLPDTWVWSSVDELADVQAGAAKSRKLENAAGCVERPYLSVANVQRGHLELDDVKTMWVRSSKIEALTLRRGDVLFNEGGDKDKLGRGWIWEGQVADCVHQNHVFRARVRGDGVDPRWLSYWGNVFGRWWFHERGSQTTGIASINQKVLRSLPVPVPPPIEQQAILDELDRRGAGIDRALGAIDTANRRVQALRRSILKAAFEGRLTGSSQTAPSMAALEEAIA